MDYLIGDDLIKFTRSVYAASRGHLNLKKPQKSKFPLLKVMNGILRKDFENGAHTVDPRDQALKMHGCAVLLVEMLDLVLKDANDLRTSFIYTDDMMGPKIKERKKRAFQATQDSDATFVPLAADAYDFLQIQDMDDVEHMSRSSSEPISGAYTSRRSEITLDERVQQSPEELPYDCLPDITDISHGMPEVPGNVVPMQIEDDLMAMVLDLRSSQEIEEIEANHAQPKPKAKARAKRQKRLDLVEVPQMHQRDQDRMAWEGQRVYCMLEPFFLYDDPLEHILFSHFYEPDTWMMHGAGGYPTIVLGTEPLEPGNDDPMNALMDGPPDIDFVSSFGSQTPLDVDIVSSSGFQTPAKSIFDDDIIDDQLRAASMGGRSIDKIKRARLSVDDPFGKSPSEPKMSDMLESHLSPFGTPASTLSPIQCRLSIGNLEPLAPSPGDSTASQSSASTTISTASSSNEVRDNILAELRNSTGEVDFRDIFPPGTSKVRAGRGFFAMCHMATQDELIVRQEQFGDKIMPLFLSIPEEGADYQMQEDVLKSPDDFFLKVNPVDINFDQSSQSQ